MNYIKNLHNEILDAIEKRKKETKDEEIREWISSREDRAQEDWWEAFNLAVQARVHEKIEIEPRTSKEWEEFFNEGSALALMERSMWLEDILFHREGSSLEIQNRVFSRVVELGRFLEGIQEKSLEKDNIATIVAERECLDNIVEVLRSSGPHHRISALILHALQSVDQIGEKLYPRFREILGDEVLDITEEDFLVRRSACALPFDWWRRLAFPEFSEDEGEELLEG